MITTNQFQAIFPNCPEPKVLAAAVSAAMETYGVKTKVAKASLCGIWGNETGGMTQIGRENMRYSAERAFELFTKARDNPEITYDRCSTVPQDNGMRFASWIYGGLYGNGGESTRDGWLFRGGGITQVTFRGTYRPCGIDIGVDLEGNPDLIVTPKVASLSAVWFAAKYKPAILRYFNTGTEADFLAGGALVGWTNPHHTSVRLSYRARALSVLDGDSPIVNTPASRLLYVGVPNGSDIGELQERLGDHEWCGPRTGRDRRQVERNHRHPGAAEAAGTRRGDCHHRRDGMSDGHRSADRRATRRLRAGPQG